MNDYEKKYLEELRTLVLKLVADVNCNIYLFGSYVFGKQRRVSDFDIGFSGMDTKLFLAVRDKLLDELETSIIPNHVDIIHFDEASEEFKTIALKGAIQWKQSSHIN